jgi:DNA-binding XRE family transcriptional regulator
LKVPSFGRCLGEARVRAGYGTKSALGQKVGLSRDRIYRMEVGDRSENPTWQVAWKVIVAGELPLEYFFPPEMLKAAAGRLRRAGRSKGVSS